MESGVIVASGDDVAAVGIDVTDETSPLLLIPLLQFTVDILLGPLAITGILLLLLLLALVILFRLLLVILETLLLTLLVVLGDRAELLSLMMRCCCWTCDRGIDNDGVLLLPPAYAGTILLVLTLLVGVG